MRTYSIEKRFGASGGRMFSKRAKTEEKKRFDFFEFLVSDEKAVAPGVADYLDTLKYPDGSYDFSAKALVARSAPDIHGTCYAVCALKSMGIKPPKEALDYIERLKNDDDGHAIASATNIPDITRLERLKKDRGSFRSGPDHWDGDIDNTHWAALALRLGGRSVPKESVDYVKSLRNADGSYGLSRQNGDSGPLMRTRQALTLLRAAGDGLSPRDREKTAGYILSRLGEEGFGSLDNCYEAIVSLNLLGVELGPQEREMVKVQVAAAKPDSIGKKFKAAVIKKCIGLKLPPIAVGENSPDEKTPHSAREACYMLWQTQLEKYGSTEKWSSSKILPVLTGASTEPESSH